MRKYKFLVFLCWCFLAKAFSQDLTTVDPDVLKWTDFNESLQSQQADKIPSPLTPVKTLAETYLRSHSIVLDIGCGATGKNAACLIENGHQVVLIDIAANALAHTVENLKRKGLDHGIVKSLNVRIEELQWEDSLFQAVIGTRVFSFIPPELFDVTMRRKVFDLIEVGGYFVGDFFGNQHDWASDPKMSILTLEKIQILFASIGFALIEVTETNKELMTVAGQLTRFHTFEVIAQKIFNH